MTISREIPVKVTITKTYVRWMPVDPGEDPVQALEMWKEEPGDLVGTVEPHEGEVYDWDLEIDTDLAIHGWYCGPRMEDGQIFTQGAFA